jgi:hypothetical protein
VGEKEVTHTIQPFTFFNQHGEGNSEKHIDGKIHVANLIFS